MADSGLDVSAAQAALAFALANPQISSVLVGVRTVEEVQDNVAAADVQLSPELYQDMAALRVDDEILLNPGAWGIH